jgi:hypothetical protein
VPADPAFAGPSMFAVTAGSAGYVAVGYDNVGGAVWSSPDGTSWARLPDEPDFAGNKLLGVTIADQVTVIVGASTASNATGYAWVSK